jgi:hypothetical protein
VQGLVELELPGVGTSAFERQRLTRSEGSRSMYRFRVEVYVCVWEAQRGRMTGGTWDEILDGETLRRGDLGSVRAFFFFLLEPMVLRSSGKGFRWGNMEARDPVGLLGRGLRICSALMRFFSVQGSGKGHGVRGDMY